MDLLARLAPLLRFALTEFGPLIAFWALALAFGTKTAIAGSIAYILVDALRHYQRDVLLPAAPPAGDLRIGLSPFGLSASLQF